MSGSSQNTWGVVILFCGFFGAQRSGTMLEEDPYFCLLNELHLRVTPVSLHLMLAQEKERKDVIN